MVEYKVINESCATLENRLNMLAQEGWRMVGSHKDDYHSWPTIILERQKTGVFRD